MELLIKNGTVITENSKDVSDIYVKDGKIEKIGKNLSADGAQVIDAAGLVVCAGLFDMHCHLREPGFEYKEDIQSGTASAAAGGFTSVACMPNTNPAIDNESVIRYILERTRAVGSTNVFPIGTISKGRLGETISEMSEMKEAGAAAVSDDGSPVKNPGLMRRALIYANMVGLPVISHCEELSLLDGGVMNEGFVSTELGLRGITNAVEESMVSRDILIAEAEGLPVHIAHISTKGSVELVRAAKARGVRVTAETCPHYFSLTEEAVRGYDTNAKMNPPLRTEEDVKAIKAGLADDTIDAIATDHAPHHQDEKRCEFDYAQNGIIGFETALPLAITHLVKSGVMTLPHVLEKLTVSPAKILKTNKGRLFEGGDADITIFNPDEEFVVGKPHSKSENTPFIGKRLCGCVKYTIVGGIITYKN